MKLRLALILVATIGCSSQDPTSDWIEPVEYTFVVESSCGERAFLGTFRVHVVDGVPVDAEPLDADADSLIQWSGMDDIKPISGLIQEYRAARVDADVAEIEVDSEDGHPVEINIDYDTNAVDDEACYSISEFAIGS